VKEGYTPEGCRVTAEVSWTCRVEGRSVQLCGVCDQAWKKMANQTPALRQRCPHCAPQYFNSRTISPSGHTTGTSDGEVLTGPLADAITRAMLAEGISGDARRRVLARLVDDTDPYIVQLLRSTASAGVAI
jgi:hypothetical protein